MTLGTHAVVGASIAALLPTHPALAFFGGFISHFILDSIPHWDYPLRSLQGRDGPKMDRDLRLGKSFIIDLFRVGIDALIGITVALLLFHGSRSFPYVLLSGAVGAMVPDALQFVYFKLRKQPLISLQRFHIFIHAVNDLNDRPFLGIACQVAIVLVAYVLSIGLSIYI